MWKFIYQATKVTYCRLFLLTSAFFLSPSHSATIKLDMVTEDFPPLQILVNDKPAGYVVEFVQKLVKGASKEYPVQINTIRFVPWKRAMLIAKNTDNILFVSVARTPARENQFHWIGKVAKHEVTLFRYIDGPKVIPNSLKDLKPFRLGSQSGGNFEEYIEGKGFNLITATYGRKMLHMLIKNRIDYTPLVTSSYFYRLEQYHLDPNDFIPVLKIDDLSKDLWLVASRTTSDEVVRALKNSYQRLIQQGVLERISDSYHPESEIMLQYRKSYNK
ncbi:ABC transporter substrate-binding protein [Vibrio sp. S4M6]|uniref:substrate-binding periplasmic protein n=1 Tax=Vibrio sinus TaxID=2946865 RepID=UPI002029D572|nr:ABC transporter substrate-binding protein [Vibrio sinus]MCL9781953.1 ABC transporter substrate-binding protein [Vibrio sinus]